jgi:hypothetical protein
MSSKLPELLREEEAIRSSIRENTVYSVSETVYGELTFFDGSVSRLQWKRITRIPRIFIQYQSESKEDNNNEYGRHENNISEYVFTKEYNETLERAFGRYEAGKKI